MATASTLESLVMPARGYREAVVQAAAGQLSARDHRVNDYWRDVLGVDWHGAFPPHWCGAFNLWALHQAGLALEKLWHIAGCWPHHDSIGSGFLLTQPHALHTVPIGSSPLPGDTSYKGAPFQHHAIVESVTEDGIVHTIDGNQGPPLFIKRNTRKLGDPAYTYFSISTLIDVAEAARKAVA